MDFPNRERSSIYFPVSGYKPFSACNQRRPVNIVFSGYTRN
jgi:hypothetical protein